MQLKSIFIETITLQFTFPTSSAKYPNELKWKRQTVPCKPQQCHYINECGLDSTP